MIRSRPVALTIAGVDSSGGAGVVADLKTFEAHGVWGTAAITAVTAQNTLGVQAVETLTPEVVRAQIASVVSDLGVDAAKTGMLGSAEVVAIVAMTVVELGVRPLVVDPVMVASTGGRLLDADAVEAVRDLLLPLATVVTPNLAEAAALTGVGEIVDRAGMERAARALVDLGADVALVKGGHLGGDTSPDCMVVEGADPVWLDGPRLEANGAHGSGCVLAAAICAELARGMEPADACVAAKRFVARAIEAGPALGEGVVPVDPGGRRGLGAVTVEPGAGLPSEAVDAASHGDRLDEDQIAVVIRRASELDGQSPANRPGLDLELLEEAAVEAGLSRQSVRRAVAELRAGTLGLGTGDDARRAGLGSTTLTVSRCVPGPATAVDDILRRFLIKEQFHLRRDFGTSSSWNRRQDMRARVRVSLDKGVHRRLLLREIEHVEIAVVEEPGSDGTMVMVKLAADVRPLRRAHRLAVGQGLGVGAAAAAGGMILFGMPEALVALPVVTGSGAAVGHVVGASRYRSSVGDLETALEGYLDGIERRSR